MTKEKEILVEFADGVVKVKPSEFIPQLINVITAQYEKIERLKKKIAKIKGELDAKAPKRKRN